MNSNSRPHRLLQGSSKDNKYAPYLVGVLTIISEERQPTDSKSTLIPSTAYSVHSVHRMHMFLQNLTDFINTKHNV